MKKFIFLPLFVFGVSTYPDFSMCYNKYKKYSIIPISKNYSITSMKQKKYQKYDEDLGIYLIKTNNKKYLHFKKTHLGVWIASITKNSIYSGNYAEYQNSMKKPAKISTQTKAGSIITDIFCNPIGIGVNGGFLSQKYIKTFINSKPQIKDLLKFSGIIFNKNLIITKVLPNSSANKHFIKKGMKIVRVNNIKVLNKNDIKTALKSNKNVTITIRQDGFDFTFKGN